MEIDSCKHKYMQYFVNRLQTKEKLYTQKRPFKLVVENELYIC